MSKRVFPSTKKLNPSECAETFWAETDADPKKAKAYDKYIRDHERRLRQLERDARGEVVPGDYDNGYDE